MNEPDLLVVGAGPVGLALACEALRHGLRPRVIDLREEASIHSKAQIIHARTLELLEATGVTERLFARGLPIHSFQVYDHRAKTRLVSFPIGGLDSHFQGILSISQRDTELILTDRLEELGGTIERGVRLDTFTADDDGVRATLVHVRDDRTETIRVPWLVGADGAHSTVRRTLDLPFDGAQYAMNIIQADIRVDFPFATRPDEVIAFLTPQGVAGFFPLPSGEHRYRFLIPGAEALDREPTLDDFQRRLDRVAPEGSVASDPAWMVAFKVHCRLAPKMRVGRVLLAGDAVHIHSPAGGQGMNMGIQDAVNLAWKLALVVRGEGTSALLDSYEAERHPVAKETLEWTDTATKGGLVQMSLEQPMAVAARNQLVRFVGNLGLVQQRMTRLISMLEVAYSESPICGEHRPSLLGANVTLDAASEQPSIGSWMAFGGGPAPGHRAPDVRVDPTDAESTRVYALLHGTAHTLLLFDGAAHTRAGYENLSSIARRVGARYGDRVETHVIVPLDTRPDALDPSLSVVLDAAGAYHRTYGAETESLYLVRPDLYVGYRSQPANGDALLAHLDRVLTPAP